MKQPIPRNSNKPLQIGNFIQIVPELKDFGDDDYSRFVIETPEDCTRVRIVTIVPGLMFQPTEWIEAKNLIVLIK